MRITYDPAADAVYIHLTDDPLTPGRTTTQASTRLRHDLLDQAETND